MIDIHNHILPGIDDGAQTLEDFLNMINIAKEDGITQIIATPHFYRGRYENNYDDIVKLLKRVDMEKKKLGTDVEIIPGQEVFLDNYTLEAFKEGAIKGINDTRYMLIELPMNRMDKNIFNLLYELRILGIVPIIAHPERYMYIIEKPTMINEFIQENCLFQINSGSITGIFGKEIKKVAEILIKNGIANFIASDSHSTNRRRPNMKKPLELVSSMNRDIIMQILDNPEKLLNNQEIKQSANKLKEKKKIFAFF